MIVLYQSTRERRKGNANIFCMFGNILHWSFVFSVKMVKKNDKEYLFPSFYSRSEESKEIILNMDGLYCIPFIWPIFLIVYIFCILLITVYKILNKYAEKIVNLDSKSIIKAAIQKTLSGVKNI